jgi:SAM-dependent methyltransferase
LAARLENARVEKADIVEISENLEGPFDYIVAHGLYAWVPPIVQRATLRLIGRLLSENGVAFISYNAMPGGHIRMLLRDMMLHNVAGIDDPLERARAGRNYLASFAERTPEDTPLRLGLRSQAALAAHKRESALAHDEGGLSFDPQYITALAAAAQDHDLAYLNDAQRSLLQDGFLADDDPDLDEEGILRRVQGHDHERTCFFRESLFIRRGAVVQRRIDPKNVSKLWLAFRGKRSGRHVLEIDKSRFEIGDDRLCELLEQAASIYPHRIPLASARLQDDQLEAILRVFDKEGIELHAEQCPGELNAERPCASGLARAQIDRGDDDVCRLDHRLVTIAEPGPRAFLRLLDGTRDRADLAAAWAQTPYHGEIDVDKALAMLGGAGLL